MKKNYNKLVRDKIPEIIKANNGELDIRILNQQEYIDELFKKVKEEAQELIKVKDNKKEVIKEIADLYEVIEAIIENLEINKAEIIKLKQQRKNKRGSFKKRIFLQSVDE